jgi:hypothetical protein
MATAYSVSQCTEFRPTRSPPLKYLGNLRMRDTDATSLPSAGVVGALG